MISLTKILNEINTDDLINSLLKKIQDKQYYRIGAGDNGVVYQINDEDYVYKITREPGEFDVAAAISGNPSTFSCFIPVLYTNQENQMYIMSNATDTTTNIKTMIDDFTEKFNKWALDTGGEVSIFDFISQTDIDTDMNPMFLNFLTTLESQIKKINVPELDLDLDFKSDNVMQWQGKLVLVDW